MLLSTRCTTAALRHRSCLLLIGLALVIAGQLVVADVGWAAVASGQQTQRATGGGSGSSLEAAADRATDTGRTVAIQLIALGLAIAAVVLGIKRDFKEAVGVFAIGILAVLLATPSGIDLLRDTVQRVFG